MKTHTVYKRFLYKTNCDTLANTANIAKMVIKQLSKIINLIQEKNIYYRPTITSKITIYINYDVKSIQTAHAAKCLNNNESSFNGITVKYDELVPRYSTLSS